MFIHYRKDVAIHVFPGRSNHAVFVSPGDREQWLNFTATAEVIFNTRSSWLEELPGAGWTFPELTSALTWHASLWSYKNHRSTRTPSLSTLSSQPLYATATATAFYREPDMSTYATYECRRVTPSVHGNKFDTAHRKKAVANIFENVNQEAVMRLFQKTGDMKAEERVRSIFSYSQDPEETSRALMALKQRKKDKFLQIAGMIRQVLKLRWSGWTTQGFWTEPDVKVLPVLAGGSPVRRWEAMTGRAVDHHL